MEHFLSGLALKLAKSDDTSLQKCVRQKNNRESCTKWWVRIHRKKLAQKSLKPKTFGHSNKSIKLHFSVTFSLTAFFNRFFATFSLELRSTSNSAFLISTLILWQKKTMDHFSTFSKLWSQMPRKWLKQAKKLFYTCVLELNMQLSTAWDNPKLLKLLYPRMQWTIHCTLQYYMHIVQVLKSTDALNFFAT